MKAVIGTSQLTTDSSANYNYIIPNGDIGKQSLDITTTKWYTNLSDYSDYLMDEIIEKIKNDFNKSPVVEYKCHNCGAELTIDNDNHIFKCPYCRSVYAIGTNHINSGC